MARTKIQMQRMQMRIKLPHDIRYAQHFANVNPEQCQASEAELFVKAVNDLRPLKTVIAKRGRVLGVYPLHENGFKFLDISF